MIDRCEPEGNRQARQKARELELRNQCKSADGPYRVNSFKHIESKEQKVIAKYRRIDWTARSISFQYKLEGSWFWKDYTLTYISDLSDSSPDYLEQKVQTWLECYSRTGQV